MIEYTVIGLLIGFIYMFYLINKLIKDNIELRAQITLLALCLTKLDELRKKTRKRN